MATLVPLPMSQKKDDLLKHLGMGLDTYNVMATETDLVYKWLTSDQRHLKSNCSRQPPYDWSDIVERSKDEAMRRIAQSDDAHTRYYWKLGTGDPDCVNWVARWFLYHKFRYRDGRNRNPVKREDGKRTNSSSTRHSHHRHRKDTGVEKGNEYFDSYGKDCESAASTSTSNGYGTDDHATRDAYPPYQYAPSAAATYQQEGQYNEQAKGSEGSGYWDPVRDSVNGR